MKIVIVFSIGLSAFLSTWAQMEFVPVFTAGTDGYKSYRIPAIVALPGGDLLAFAEGRVYGSADFGDINIVMKRSSDKGKTWGAMQIVAEFDTLVVAFKTQHLADADVRLAKWTSAKLVVTILAG